MKILPVLFFSLVFLVQVNAQKNDLSVKNLTTEYKTNPMGIDIVQPRLSWQIQTLERNTMQSAYEIRAALSIEALNSTRGLLWNTGKVLSGQSIHVSYKGKELQSSQRVYWKVRIWDNHGRTSDWSLPAFWETGLLDTADWKALWISPDVEENTGISQPSPYLRKSFSMEKEIARARLYISCQGLYQAEINGKRVGNEEFTPGWTSYHNRIQYQTYDIASYLQKGDNAIGIILGDGWYRGNIGWVGNRNEYGSRLAAIAMVSVQYKDGSTAIISTDDSWKSATGPILKSDIYNGEWYDARLEMPGWSRPGFDESKWTGTRLAGTPKNLLVAPQGPPVARIQTLTPKSINRLPDNTWLVDMGQNMVGWIAIKATGKSGDTLQLKHVEVLDKMGNPYYDNLRSAQQTNVYILKGEEEQTFEPHFTFQGFRYVVIDNYPGTLTADKINGIVIHSDMEPAGNFSCSDPLINQLQHNIQWGQKGNFLEVPTDCPQRDERLGWTGDAQVFAPTACFNMNTASFYTKWLRDVAFDQKETGAVPHVVPDVLGDGGATGWADVAVVIPWTLYLNYADTGILRTQYTSMKKWIEYMVRRAGDDDIWQEDWHFGDWLSFDDHSPAYMGAYTTTDLIATAYFAYSTDIMGKVSGVLGLVDDMDYYNHLYSRVRKAFQQEFVTGNGRLVSHTQTAYTLALAFELLDEAQAEKAAAFLAGDVKRFGHITTGFLGTPLICQTLTEYGYIDLAYQLLMRKEYPSWLYPVTMGATTIWERWDGMKPDSTFQDKGMNSFNHYAYGAIGKWLYETIAGIGINPEKPGYRDIIIHPRPGGGLTQAEASHESPFGKISSAWKMLNNEFTLDITLPPNATASVVIPGNAKEPRLDGATLTENELIRVKGSEDAILKIGSGNYQVKYILNH